MSDLDDHPGGDEPDTIDGRLESIARLVDTLIDETLEDRRRRRRETITRLLDDLQQELTERIEDLRARAE